ncbi:hypothetical protein [Amycolatopsis sp. NPDC052450]|uniref:hypothetical protein n=1 Tax=Amycolatopsis sp. NPDC052450 TaxID=3363937 RepID=UPI0037C9A939
MTTLADRLAVIAGDGAVASWAELDELAVADHAEEIAASPLAPVLAQALAAAAGASPPGWDGASAKFVTGLSNQTSLLALASSLEELLASPITVQTQGARLHDALLDGLTVAIADSPLLAAGRLEGAVRLAVANAVTPFAVLGRLTSLSNDVPEEFAERLPRLLGAAMDRWADNSAFVEPIRQALDQLRHHEAAAVDAVFELACDHLRVALSAETLPAAMESLTTARAGFATVDAAEEARHDARAYAAACDAILAFSAQNAYRLTDAKQRLAEALQQRDAWLTAMHQPAWLRPKLAAELAWHRLVLVLEAATDYLSHPVWFNVWEALDAVLQAYRQARSMRPLPSSKDSTGLAAIIEPAIEGAILQKQSQLLALSRSITEAAKSTSPAFDVQTAELLLARIELLATGARDRQPRSSSSGPADGDRGDDEPHHPPDTTRLYALAPSLTRVLGEQQAALLAEGLDDNKLRTVEGLAYSGDLTRSRTSHPALDPLLQTILQGLAQSPAFTGEAKSTFSLLVQQTLLFLFSRADLTTKTLGWPKKKDYRRLLNKGEKKPLEEDLQQDYHQWLAAGPLAGLCTVEMSDVATGRADVLVAFGTIRYLTEIKRETARADRAKLEAKYLQQAAEYGNTNVPLGQLLVLDLAPHPDGTARIDESVWVARHKPQGTHLNRSVVVGVIAGNRATPSGLST